MKNYRKWIPLTLFLAAMLCSVANVMAQSTSAEPVQAMKARRLSEQRKAMWILAAWAGASMASGSAMAIQNKDTSLRFQGFQHVGWGAVNAAIAGFALYGLSGSAQDSATLFSEFSEEQTFSKILLVNVGLDVGYMLVGSTLMVASRNGLKDPDKFFGSGLGVVIQGAFLLVFDIVQVLWSSQRLDALAVQIAPRLSYSPQGMMLGVAWNF
jgi:hypothetical protein